MLSDRAPELSIDSHHRNEKSLVSSWCGRWGGAGFRTSIHEFHDQPEGVCHRGDTFELHHIVASALPQEQDFAKVRLLLEIRCGEYLDSYGFLALVYTLVYL
jgi:hypothetical protein